MTIVTSNIISTSVQSMFQNCPATFLDLALNTFLHFEQFKGASLPEIIESFMFGMLANSIEFRSIFLAISSTYGIAVPQSTVNATASNATYYLTLAESFAQFMKSVIYFNNLYLPSGY